MIRFPCHCRTHVFTLPESDAGGLIQCPKCGRLNDVPLLSDLAGLEEDGTFRIEAEVDRHESPARRLHDVREAFTAGRRDDRGEEIDLRPTMEEVMSAGAVAPIELVDGLPNRAPHYDPLTGELIRPLEIKPDPVADAARANAAAIPMAKRVVQYARDAHASENPLRAAAHLLAPSNLFVMSMVLGAHVLVMPFVAMRAAGIFFVAPVLIAAAACFIAHYGNVIDEIGPAERDELPRPLRDAALVEDIWAPFVHVLGALLLCYGPAIVANRCGLPVVAVFALFAAGTLFVPAVMLTTSTSGSTANLRPDRVMRVISCGGGAYLIAIAIFVVTSMVYGVGMWRFQYDFLSLFVRPSMLPKGASPWWFERWCAYPALAAGVFAAHWYCWTLGLIYRAHHHKFGWVLQRHMPTRLRDRTRRPAPALGRSTAAAPPRTDTATRTREGIRSPQDATTPARH